jgi:nicotinate-nucleotide pyrophosphorylase (carboxylating)
VLCGCAWFARCFEKLDPAVDIAWRAQDGALVRPDDVLCEIAGPARALLTGERSALNFLQLLSGVASKARQFADRVAGTRAQVVDTRKTIPGLRVAQKYAVRCGGGGNHRLGLYDGILIKENHILAAGSIGGALDSARRVAEQVSDTCQFIQVEVETLDELQQALAAGATMILGFSAVGVLAALFVPLERVFTAQRQGHVRPGFWVDVAFVVFQYLLMAQVLTTFNVWLRGVL